MDFVDISFPDRIAFGAQGDSAWSTNVLTMGSGFENTNQNWRDARHYFDVSFAIRNVTAYQLVRTHFHQMRGRAKKFPFKDYLDFQVSASEGVMLDDGESPSGDYQLYKRYGAGGDAYDRKITRPKTGTLTIYRTRSGVTTNITGSATIDYSTGLVTVTGHQSGDAYTWAGEFWVPCRYDTDRLPAIIVNKEPGSTGELLVDCASIPIVEVKE